MNTLIIYATKNGSVKEVAQLLRKELTGSVRLVNAHEEQVEDISCYDNILIGSSIYFGQIDRKIKNFIFLHRPEILNRRFGIFIMAGESNKDILEKQLKDTIPNDMFTKASAISVIGSEIKLKKFSWLVRLLLKYVKKVKCSYKDIDKDKIKDFANNFNKL
jgi:menaquinone-dependent protoporphyrinogen oxidase